MTVTGLLGYWATGLLGYWAQLVGSPLRWWWQCGAGWYGSGVLSLRSCWWPLVPSVAAATLGSGSLGHSVTLALGCCVVTGASVVSVANGARGAAC